MLFKSKAHQALEVQQSVIPPLSRTGGCRCYVKLPSRGALMSRNQETHAFAKDPWLNSRLGVGKSASCNFQLPSEADTQPQFQVRQSTTLPTPTTTQPPFQSSPSRFRQPL
ncbi:hypothetical protein LR48_Vigan02g213700 [Vigna angularis]|uniref:Uncharacterized protein n=1 Tax=Phaseolus angularis TaxID=3914 RepID=A0A0L9U013_PHAAN|nr:hypothetical protein LR48_Vigan02g213700 [Vigna angularis]